MPPIWIARIFFVLFMTWGGYLLGRPTLAGLQYTIAGLVFGLFIVAVEHSTRVLSTKKIALSVLGAFFGLAFASLFERIIPTSFFPNPEMPRFALSLLFMYLGMVMAMRQADRISLSKLRFFVGAASENTVLLDTSAIIDGRITGLYKTGALTRSSTVPTFVVDELQTLADSRDPEKRGYGRRGLEHLDEIRRTDPGFNLVEKDYPDVKDVDHKLIALAKEMNCVLVSTDFNLCKVAALHRIKTLNINEVAAAVRINLAVGDQAVIYLQREGKESHQGVGHLDDGTMVVVEHASHLIGKQVHVGVLSILQTSAGRLAFARLMDREAEITPASGPRGTKARIEVVKGAGDGSG